MDNTYTVNVQVVDKLEQCIDSLYILKGFLGGKKELSIEDITRILGIVKTLESVIRASIRDIENEKNDESHTCL